MANTTFANLKKKALQLAGNSYNASDSTRLELAGGIINDCLSSIQSMIKGSVYTYSVGNTVNTVADQAYVALTDTDILDVVNVYQRVSDTKLIRLPRSKFTELQPDTTRFAGTPEIAWSASQALVAGVNTWSLYLLPTPSAVIALYYDYEVDMRFSADGTGADAEFSPLPMAYDDWIYSEFRPRFYQVIDSGNRTRIATAEEQANTARAKYSLAINSVDQHLQLGSAREMLYRGDIVETTTAP